MNKVKTWYVDMDDTLCDFSGQAYLDLRETPDIRWPQSQHGFFTKLRPLANAIESLKELDTLGEDVWILTRPSCCRGKNKTHKGYKWKYYEK